MQACIPSVVVQHAHVLAAQLKKAELTCFPAVPQVRAQAEVLERMHTLMIRHTLCPAHEANIDYVSEEWKSIVKLVEAAEAEP